MMPPSRSQTPFFHDRNTHHLIEEIADSQDLVIFAGAGVTIDRTGLNWSGLLRGLLSRVASSAEEHQAVLSYAAERTEPHFASVIRAMYERSGQDWNRRLLEDTHALLYSERTWRGGRYATAIARLVIAARATGRRVTVVTTNQDEFIEIALRSAAVAAGEKLSVSTLSLELKEARGEPKVVPIPTFHLSSVDEGVRVLHVHGAVQKDPRLDSKVGSIVLGERDFFDWEEKVKEVLVRLFSVADVLIVGAGLEDANLLRALHHTKRLRSAGAATQGLTGRRIWYISTKSELVRGDISDEAVERARLGLDKRLNEFGVTAVLPDMYSQAHQLLLEVAEEYKNGTAVRRYSDSDAEYRYGRRLRTWWESWDQRAREQRPGAERTNAEGRLLLTQADHHATLLEVEAKVRAVMADIKSYRRVDQLKVEVWLRWDPADTSRRLRLWASSLGSWATPAGFKDEEISNSSDLAAVRAFCSGSADLRVDVGKRWGRYLAVPIEVSSSGATIIVGSVVVASTNPALLSWKEVSPMRELVEHLPRWVSPVASVGTFKVSGVGLPVD